MRLILTCDQYADEIQQEILQYQACIILGKQSYADAILEQNIVSRFCSLRYSLFYPQPNDLRQGIYDGNIVDGKCTVVYITNFSNVGKSLLNLSNLYI